jgi:hypothetical protein
MELTAIYKRVIGLDVHPAKISACAVAEQANGKVTVESRESGGFKRDRRALAQWAKSFGPEVVVMESTGICWKSPYAALKNVGIAAWVVNARHVKTVPHGQAARAMVKALIEGQTIAQMLDLAGRLRASRADLFEALQPEELSGAHLFVLTEIMAHIEELEARMGRFEQAVLAGLSPWGPRWCCCRPSPVLMSWERPCCWWRSVRTCTALAVPSGWLSAPTLI